MTDVDRSRRRLVAALGSGALAAGTGCLDRLGLGSEPPVRLRSTRANGDETDITCRLDADVVAANPPLERVLTRAADREKGEWATVGVDESTAEAINEDLVAACERTRGLYRYDGQWFFVSMRFTSAGAHREYEQGGGHTHEGTTDHDHGGETSHRHENETSHGHG